MAAAGLQRSRRDGVLECLQGTALSADGAPALLKRDRRRTGSRARAKRAGKS